MRIQETRKESRRRTDGRSDEWHVAVLDGVYKHLKAVGGVRGPLLLCPAM